MTDQRPSAVEALTCEFVPANEPWECKVHRGIRTRLDEPQCDAIRPVKPLTAGQLDNLRRADTEGRVPHNRYIVRGLLATLDATRPAERPIHAPECMGVDAAAGPCAVTGWTARPAEDLVWAIEQAVMRRPTTFSLVIRVTDWGSRATYEASGTGNSPRNIISSRDTDVLGTTLKGLEDVLQAASPVAGRNP